MTGQPTETEVRAALERIVSSPGFAKARRSQAFLRFVTEETIAGRERAVSGYDIAINVFGKSPEFDGGHDPLVRVEARRLRSRLRHYYATVGGGDAVRIELEPGSYAPAFRFAAHAPTAGRGNGRRSRTQAARLIAVSVTLLVAVTWTVGSIDPRSSAIGVGEREPAAVATPRIRIEPFRAAETPDTEYLAFGITEEIMTRLAGYRDLRILVASGSGLGATAPNGVRADFVLSGSVSTANDVIHAVPQLVDARSGRRIWTATYDEPLAADSVWQVVESVAAAVGEPYGPLFDAEVTRNALSTAADPYHCLLRFVFALQVISEAAHGRATACFEEAVATDPRSSLSWGGLAALYRMEYLHGFNAKVEARPPLDRAEDAARRALDGDAHNPFAHQEMAFLSLLRGDRSGFEESVARTLELNPSADIRAALGINFVKMGEVERGLALIDQGIADSPRAPPFSSSWATSCTPFA